MGINTDAVQRLYVAYFNRPADPVGLAHWESKLPSDRAATQAELTALANQGFSGSSEYSNLYSGKSNTQIIDSLYQNLFGRSAETAGLTSWALALSNGTQTFASIALQLTYSAQGTDATAIANKLTAAKAFTTALDTTAEITGYSGTAAAASARTWLATVTDSAASLTNATTTSAINAAVSNATAAGASSSGQTYMLTAGVDSPAATERNDTFIGTFGSATASDNSFGIGDVLDGGAGKDTLNLTVIGGADSAAGATVKNIETINIRGLDTVTFNTVNVTGANTINATETLAGTTTTVSNLASTATTLGLAGKGNLTATFDLADLSGKADTVSVNLSGAGTSAATRSTVTVSNGNAIEAVKIAATGANFVNLDAGTANASITVTGAGSLNLASAGGAAFTGDATNAALTIDASAATGAQTYSLGSGAITVKGGSAGDSFTFGATLGSTDSVDGGAGADTLSFEVGNAVQILPTVSNVEVLAAKFSAGGIFNASKTTGVTTINTEVTNGTAVSYVNLANTAATLNFNKENNSDATASGAVSVSYATGAKAVVAMTIGETNTTTTTGDTIDLGATSFANVDILTITSVRDADNTASVTNTLASLDVGSATALTINTGDLAAINTGNLVGASVAKLNVAANGGAATTGAFVGAALTDLTLTSANKAALTTGALGTANSTTTASKLVNYSVTTGASTTVNLGAVDAATKSGAAGTLDASALKTIKYDLGSAATATIGAVDATDENGDNGNAGAGVAQLDSISFKLGADATADVAVGAISARSVTVADFTTADHAAARAVGATLNMDESLGALNITSGKNVTSTLTVNGIDDVGATDLYDSAITTITGNGAGNVAIAGLATGIKSIGSIDLSAVTGTSEVALSTLSGTVGVTVTVGSGGTTATGVSGSNNADIITGGKGADVLFGGAGDDQITGGLGADIITGGAGKDVIDLTEATSAIDTLRYAESAAANVDTVTGFKVNNDIVSYSIGNIAEAGVGDATLSTGNGADIAAAVAAGAAVFTAVAKDTAVAADATTHVLKLTATDASSFGTAIGTGSFAIVDADWTAASEGLAATYFDSLNGEVVFGYIRNTDTGTADVINSADTFVEVVRIGMTSADFTAMNNTSFSLF